jgi:predicted transcriptional regulator
LVSSKKGWYSYYKIKKEPNLAIRALTQSKELDLFVGRKEAIADLKEWQESKVTTFGILSGEAGTGKTSLVCKAFSNLKGFIRIDVSKVPSFSMAPSLIAKALIDECLKSNCNGAKTIEKEYKYAIRVTKGRQLAAGSGPMPAKVESIYHETHVPFVVPDHVYSIVNKAIKLLHRKFHKLALVFDEADPELKEDATVDNVIATIQAFELPGPSIFIWPVRSDEVRKNWRNPKSNERRLFDWHKNISHIGTVDAPSAWDILNRRLLNVGVKKGERIISPEVAEDIAVLVDGNLREFIRFCRDILRKGAREKVKLPISLKYAISTIRKIHGELLDSEERRMLQYLKNSPSSASSTKLQKKFNLKRRTLQDHLDILYKKKLVTYKRQKSKSGKYQNVYSPSKKAKLLLI